MRRSNRYRSDLQFNNSSKYNEMLIIFTYNQMKLLNQEHSIEHNIRVYFLLFSFDMKSI
jgi:hypothetical protein